jgi:hypothetical protein
MAVAKAVSSSNPLVASRISLEAALDTFSQVFAAVPIAAARERLRGFCMPDLAAACDGFMDHKTNGAAKPADAAALAPASSDGSPRAAK